MRKCPYLGEYKGSCSLCADTNRCVAPEYLAYLGSGEQYSFSPDTMRQERKENHITFGDLYKETGISTDRLRGIERGEVIPREQTIRKIATGLGITPEILFSQEKKS